MESSASWWESNKTTFLAAVKTGQVDADLGLAADAIGLRRLQLRRDLRERVAAVFGQEAADDLPRSADEN